MSIDMEQFHQVFFEESFEGLDIMESGLLNMDPGAADPEEINSIFRAAHSIKGGGGTFGFDHISSFTHVMETLLDEMRDGRRVVTTETINVLLSSVDVLREMLTATSDGEKHDDEQADIQQVALNKILNGEAVASPEASEDVGEAATSTGQNLGWHIVFRPLPHMLRTGNDSLRIIRELDELGDLKVTCDLSTLPSLDEYEPEDSYLSWDIYLYGEISRDTIDEVFTWVDDDCELAVMELIDEAAIQAAEIEEADVERVEKLASVPEAENKRSGEDRRKNDRRKKSGSASSSIRVDISKIDTLINMVGELVITQSMLSMLGEDAEDRDGDREERMRDGLAQLERHTRELQESVMQIRMVPISFTFSRFPRLVHDLSTKMGKKIELKMTGENTEVDKTVIEKIGDPLVHLVRNSLDHGLEMPDERVAAGKPETGTVQLNACHKGGNIVIVSLRLEMMAVASIVTKF